MRVALDVDGVLADFTRAWLDHAEHAAYEVDGKHVQFDRSQQVTYGYDDIPLSDAARARTWQRMAEPGVAASLGFVPGSAGLPSNLRLRGHEVVYATAPLPSSPTWAFERINWLSRHFGAARGDVVLVSRKELVNADVLVDDSLEHCNNWARTGRMALLWDAPYNQPSGALVFDDVVRVRCVRDVLERLS